MKLLVVCALSFVGMATVGCSVGMEDDTADAPPGENVAPPGAEPVGSIAQAATVAAVWQCHYEYHDQPGKGWYYCCESGSSVCISRYDGNNSWGNYVCNF